MQCPRFSINLNKDLNQSRFKILFKPSSKHRSSDRESMQFDVQMSHMATHAGCYIQLFRERVHMNVEPRSTKNTNGEREN